MSQVLYRPLENDGDSFRLLQLHPGQEGDPIVVSIVPARLSQCQPYDAVSYVWGSPENQPEIEVDGVFLTIRRSLFDFLGVLRKPTSPRLLYADAVCINQTDDKEKSRQVPMMGDIYKSATRVLAWLGPGSPESDALFHMSSRVSAQDCHLDENGKPHWKQDICSPSERTSLQSTLQKILDRDYWKRAWIIQECLLARVLSLYSGHAETSWDQFLVLHMMLLNKKPIAERYTWGSIFVNITRFDHLAGERARIHEYPKSLGRIVETFNAVESTDPRDMVYAFSGLIRESQPGYPGRIVVDYSTSATLLYFQAGYVCLLKNEYRPHRILHALRSMLKLSTVGLLDVVCELMDPDDLLSPVDWIVGNWEVHEDPKGRVFRKERKGDLDYMHCHVTDLATLIHLLESKNKANPEMDLTTK